MDTGSPGIRPFPPSHCNRVGMLSLTVQVQIGPRHVANPRLAPLVTAGLGALQQFALQRGSNLWLPLLYPSRASARGYDELGSWHSEGPDTSIAHGSASSLGGRIERRRVMVLCPTCGAQYYMEMLQQSTGALASLLWRSTSPPAPFPVCPGPNLISERKHGG
jgi:hypothetical protein